MDPERSLEAHFQIAVHYQSDMVELMPPIGAMLAPWATGTCAGQDTGCRRIPGGVTLRLPRGWPWADGLIGGARIASALKIGYPKARSRVLLQRRPGTPVVPPNAQGASVSA